MSKENKQNLSQFEQMERIEHRLAELSLIQKLLFHKYLDIAEKTPAYHQKLKKIQHQLPPIKERKVFGQPIDHHEMMQRLQVEEWEIKLEQKKLEHIRLRQKLSEIQTKAHTPIYRPSHEEPQNGHSPLPVKYFLLAGLIIVTMVLLFSGLAMINQ
ncbi:MAG: hypothetical protein AAF985_27210 [Bacteroidota bacterium]